MLFIIFFFYHFVNIELKSFFFFVILLKIKIVFLAILPQKKRFHLWNLSHLSNRLHKSVYRKIVY